MYVYHIFFVRLSVDGHSSFFRVLAVVNSAAVNIGCLFFWLLYVFVAEHGLSLVAESREHGLLESLGCGAGFSLRWLLLVAEHML